MDDIEKIVKSQILAIIPTYLKMKGNSTKIITKESGDIYIYKSIRTFMSVLAKFFAVDLNAARKYYGQLVGYSNIVPIPFNSDNIFIPVKTRKPLCRNDGSLGYVNLKFIKGVEENSDGVYVVLNSDVKIKSIQKSKTLKKHIRDGNIVKKIYENKNGIVVMESSGDFYTEFNRPATKGDIAVLRSELLAIKSKLGSSK